MADTQVEQAIVPVQNDRSAILARLGIADTGARDFTKIIREHFKATDGLKGKDLQLAVNNVLKGNDYLQFVDNRQADCERKGWIKRYSTTVNKEGEVTSETFKYVKPTMAKPTMIGLAQAEEVRKIVGQDAFDALVAAGRVKLPKGAEPREVETTPVTAS